MAVCTSDMTVPMRRFTCSGCAGSSSLISVGPRLPHTTRPVPWPVSAARSAMACEASRTGSRRCSLASPSSSARWPSSYRPDAGSRATKPTFMKLTR
ncbi:Uncharacterised protein [Bordetella pertussis]|nr:Uncharacterised protein [Bordetella pertussis]